ncbi:MAG: sigma-70 family RNA polymerase sigma factor [Phycisphaerales bacterium]|nr:sigma-70 family RNA polymerase sigma factor [Phycisphaerales bacterium]
MIPPTHPNEPPGPGGDATLLLQRVSDGDAAAANDLLPMVYAELRARAGAYFRGQPASHTLQPTALVHEAYVKLVNAPADKWNNRAHFCAVAATAMRQILVDHARRKAASRRAHDAHAAEATLLETPSSGAAIDLLALNDALDKLKALNERQARLVELRFFGGMTNQDVADVLGLSLSMIEKEWRAVRAWLARELTQGGGQ